MKNRDDICLIYFVYSHLSQKRRGFLGRRFKVSEVHMK